MILVLVETDREASAVEVSLEALTFAPLARRGGRRSARSTQWSWARSARGLQAQLSAYGVRDVHHLTGAGFAAFAGAAWASGIETVLASTGSVVVMAAGTPRGGEVLAHLAARAGVAMAANVRVVRRAVAVRGEPAGGRRPGRRGDAALHPAHRASPSPATRSRRAAAARSEPLGVVSHAPEVADGRPGGPGGLHRGARARPVRQPASRPASWSARAVAPAARTASATCSSSPTCWAPRWACPGSSPRLGWRPHHEQVGQTGSRISPDLYIPCGISGAIQHWAGCSSAKAILAINTDPDAPMVTKATHAVIGDLHEVVPAINAEIRRRAG